MGVYEPKPILANDVPSLQRAVAEELREVAAATVEDLLALAVKHVEPSKVYIGLIAYADGTDWDPGSGEGMYVYKSGGWTFIA